MEEKKKVKLAIMEITHDLESTETMITVYVKEGQECLPVIIRKMAENHVFPKDISVSSPTLDDVFLQVIKNKNGGV